MRLRRLAGRQLEFTLVICVSDINAVVASNRSGGFYAEYSQAAFGSKSS